MACGRPDASKSSAQLSGQQLAERYCQSCHLLPVPSQLARETWERWMLPRMARRLGVRDVTWPANQEPVEGGEGGRRIREAGVYPDTPRISRADWDKLAAYYLKEAPESLPHAATPPVTMGLPGFRVRLPDFQIKSPMVTLVHVDSAHRRIYVGDATPGHSTLSVLDSRGHARKIFPIPSPVSHLQLFGDTLGVLLMGKLEPHDAALGTLGLVSAWRPGANPAIAWRIDSLQRPVYASYADLNGDGIADVVVSEFGNLTGSLTWYERLRGGGSRRHLLTPQPGALTTIVGDFDGDGRPDILSLMAQGDEGISLFHGQPNGGGDFSREVLLRFPPSYGSTSMQLVDMNCDGYPDIVYTNGDAGDYPGPPKPYHGIRIFLNDGHWHFTEKYFFPMPGVMKAIARDFDGDGNVDIAAISFFTDDTRGAPLPFVFLKNTGGLHFTARTFAEASRGRWLVMDAGDIDGDGDDDIVLGSFAQPDAQPDPRQLSAPWHQPGAPTVIILENILDTPRKACNREQGPLR